MIADTGYDVFIIQAWAIQHYIVRWEIRDTAMAKLAAIISRTLVAAEAHYHKSYCRNYNRGET